MSRHPTTSKVVSSRLFADNQPKNQYKMFQYVSNHLSLQIDKKKLNNCWLHRSLLLVCWPSLLPNQEIWSPLQHPLLSRPIRLQLPTLAPWRTQHLWHTTVRPSHTVELHWPILQLVPHSHMRPLLMQLHMQLNMQLLMVLHWPTRPITVDLWSHIRISTRDARSEMDVHNDDLENKQHTIWAPHCLTNSSANTCWTK
jgi:hypothetical protein